MLKENTFIRKLNDSNIERKTRLQPVNYKYLRWNQIQKYIIPIYIDYSNLSLEEAKRNVQNFILENDVLRMKIMSINEINIMKMVSEEIPVYEVDEKQMENICYEMAEIMLCKSVYNNILYNCAFFKIQKQLLFFGLFSHLITDGYIDIDENQGIKSINHEFNYLDFEKYLNNLAGNDLVDFDKYLFYKKILVNNYLCNDMNYYHFIIKDIKRICNKFLTLEEFWGIVISSFLKKYVDELKEVPLNITSRGRVYSNNKRINAFGDFHEDFIFSIRDYKEFYENFRYYREKAYLNAQQYENFLKVNNEYSQYIEPITLSIKWNIDSYNILQNIRKKLPKHTKQAVLGFNIIVSPNLRSVQIDIRASKKLDFLFKDFVKCISSEIDCLRNNEVIC